MVAQFDVEDTAFFPHRVEALVQRFVRTWRTWVGSAKIRLNGLWT